MAYKNSLIFKNRQRPSPMSAMIAAQAGAEKLVPPTTAHPEEP